MDQKTIVPWPKFMRNMLGKCCAKLQIPMVIKIIMSPYVCFNSVGKMIPSLSMLYTDDEDGGHDYIIKMYDM